MKRLALMLACFFISMGLAIAQNKQVSGTVVDETGEPVIGASVVAKGTTTGTVTDVDGKFSLSVPGSVQTLVIKYLGMQDQDVAAGTNVKIALRPDARMLNEVVVTALGIKRSEKSLGYAATSVKGEVISSQRSTDVLSALSGKIAGVQITATGSDPGSANSVIIRGISSLSGSNQPLYIVDGVPIVNNVIESIGRTYRQTYSLGNGANLVSPDNIENLTVLKGAAATAMYGSRAANGVILITTKTGKKDQPLRIEVNAGLQIAEISKLPELQNSFGQGWFGSKTPDENGSWGPAFDGRNYVYGTIYNNSQLMKPYKALPNNLRDFFENGVMYSNSASLAFGSDKSTYYVGISNIQDDGVLPGNKDKNNVTSMTFNASSSYKNWLEVSSSVNIVNQQTGAVLTGAGASVIDGLYELPRDISIVDLKDLSNPFNTPGYYFTPYAITNPYYALEYNLTNVKQNKVFGKLQADIKPLSNLTFTYRLGYDYSNAESKIAMPRFDLDGTPNEGSISNPEGFVNLLFSRRYELNHDFFGVYTPKVKDIDITAILGLNANERYYSEMSTNVTNLSIPTFYDLTNGAGVPTVGEAMWKRRLFGVFGDVQLNYKEMVFVGLTARNDWSSTLPIKNNSFFYSGITGSFIFTELLPKNDILSFGKVRAAWGKTGNDADVYLVNPGFVAGYANNQYSAATQFPIGGLNAYKIAARLGSSNLQPEMTSEMEFGANLQFFNARLGLDAAYYDRTSDKQIFPLNIDPATGYTSQVTNLGKISNKGVELLLTTVPVKTKDFTWSLDFNFSKNKSKVVSLPEELGGFINLNQFTTTANAVYMRAEVGQPVGTFYTLNTEKDDKGNVVADPNTGLPIATTTLVATGLSVNPDWEGGVSTTLSYKGISINAALDIRVGGYMFSRSKDLIAFTGNGIATLYNNRNTYIIPGSVNKIENPDDGSVSYVENTTPITSDYVANGQYNLANGLDGDKGMLMRRDFTKLRNLSVSYDLPKNWISKLQLNSVRVSLVGNNLFIWTPKENMFIDPESTTEGFDLPGKFGELYVNPSSRRVGFNIQVKF
ncbi:MAG: SusC/RagA family TonB-linked outer membrane protein [Candidatus Azobacteroides sp.]|nr:SusC/RagA family TonB-linked outer membrane protein [Candidatus Azobacteroides sp.]